MAREGLGFRVHLLHKQCPKSFQDLTQEQQIIGVNHTYVRAPAGVTVPCPQMSPPSIQEQLKGAGPACEVCSVHGTARARHARGAA